MVLISELRLHTAYQCQASLNLYPSPDGQSLVTQAAGGRQLCLINLPDGADGMPLAINVQLCEDDYPGWLRTEDLDKLAIAPVPYAAVSLTRQEIALRLPQIIAFTQAAMAQPNQYLWGGTVAPDYDCSGLMQAAFASAGIWLPRDAYQQEAFTTAIALNDLAPGDLVFFGPPAKATHVGLYLGQGQYIHSSGKDQGRNGIGIDVLSDQGDEISRTYYRQVRGAGRVMQNYRSNWTAAPSLNQP